MAKRGNIDRLPDESDDHFLMRRSFHDMPIDLPVDSYEPVCRVCGWKWEARRGAAEEYALDHLKSVHGLNFY